MSTGRNTYDFSGRVALVTGAGSGIGAAVAARLRDGGATVAVFDREPIADYVAVCGDVAQSADVDAAVVKVHRELGRIDVVVNCAGVSGASLRTVDVSDSEWQRVLAINTSGSFWVCRSVIPGMVERGYGRIVLLASVAGKEGNPLAAAYSASKAAVIGMAKSIGKDLAGTGVLINCIAPAVIETPMLQDMSKQHVQYMLDKIPLGRPGKAEEVAAMICFLASEETTFCTGATFDLSGGRATY